MEKVTLSVSGMSCGHCEKAVKGALEGLNGVHHVTVYLQEGKVDVEFDATKVDIAALKQAIEEQGYDVA
ncbi:copper chaperone CopZ [Thermaerobacillus caldiproteolyticus]|uniref:copper chaperone CopZ n=1 Tax=Thermaerobacillus caldiproteolyticus TaxID=247480 RepID=UPI00188A2654|nr:copper chaperone CopZ [Anoxybacillus caldiproteolyticus]QPA32842.1 copper chaperone CopZ [Anoxybacillus caldiproteolyticus]